MILEHNRLDKAVLSSEFRIDDLAFSPCNIEVLAKTAQVLSHKFRIKVIGMDEICRARLAGVVEATVSILKRSRCID